MCRFNTVLKWATVMMVLCTTIVSAQTTPTASITIEGYSPQEIHDLGWTSHRSTGLDVVGVGDLVYLIGSEAGGAAVTGYAWSLAAQPGGSAATLDSTNTEQITFRADSVGKYTIELVVTTADGSSEAASVTITAAKYVGVGGMDGLPSNPTDGQCSLCHSSNFNEWQTTGHADIFTRAIDGNLSSHYRESCLECHTTGYNSDSLAVNDGFDNVQAELGWVFPDTLQAGNWDDLKANFEAVAARGNIQCESCHGPGSMHKGDATSIAMSLDEASCGYCHEEEPYHRKNQQWKSSIHARGVGFAAGRSGCADCHSGWGFVRRVDPITGDSRPETGNAQTSCAVCHDPHNNESQEQHQLREVGDVTLNDGTVVSYGGNGKACMQCHMGRRNAEEYASDPSNISSHFGPHHSLQADMLTGTNAIEYGVPIGSSGHKDAAQDACVTCHMQATLPNGDPARDKVGEHTFAMKWDGGTPDDPSDDVEHVGACQTCHGDIQSFDDIMAKADYDGDGTIEGTRDEIHGMLHELALLLPPVGSEDVITTNEDYDWTGMTGDEAAYRQNLLKAAFNFFYVEEDGSFGVHNAGYAFALLRRSIESLTTGDIGAGKIISITDVPGDQGKQVRVAWSKFAADGMAANPITDYAIWRQVDAAMVNGEAATTVGSFNEMLTLASETKVGERFSVAQEGQWDFVAWLPAQGYEVYSTVVPTLYDSTADGVHMSTFFVSGKAGATIYETAPASGYSIDNLAPSTPANIALSIADDAVELSWDEPIDEDFRYFAVYRSTEANFDPTGTTPFATLTSTQYTDSQVEIGQDYFYRLSAFDFAGNESAFSNEFSAVVTGVGGMNNVPTIYALDQNYPNPFNPTTTINYQLPEAGHVTLAVYNMLGHKVRTLVNSQQSAAQHTVVWDGRDDAGNQMPSGVYFYRINANSFNSMKKMIMMK